MLARLAFSVISHMRNLLYLMRCINPVERPSKPYVHSVDAFKYKNMSTADSEVFFNAFAHRVHLNVTGYLIVRVPFSSLLL
jgi:hypothetical protein